MRVCVDIYTKMPRTLRDWNEVLKGYSSGEDSDAGDSLNVMSVQKNAHRVAELMQSITGMSTSTGGVARPPMGMNEANAAALMRDGLAPAIAAVSLRSREAAAAAVAARVAERQAEREREEKRQAEREREEKRQAEREEKREREEKKEEVPEDGEEGVLL